MSRFKSKAHASISTGTILFLTIIFSQFLLSCSSQIVTSSLGNRPTAYDVLVDYDFPAGLLPKGVIGYDLDRTTGKFSVFLSGTCSFSLEGSYPLRYKSTIEGLISKGKLSRLEGVSVKLFFMWVDIVEVSRIKDDLDFSVGIAGAGFPIDNFEESPQCGCGFDCGDNGEVIKVRTTNPFVSSS